MNHEELEYLQGLEKRLANIEHQQSGDVYIFAEITNRLAELEAHHLTKERQIYQINKKIDETFGR